MNKIFTPLLITLFILTSSCNPSIRFGLTQKFNLNENEKEVELNNIAVDRYESIINVDTLNYPLNKYIVSDNYKIYIGVSFNDDAEKIAKFYLGNPKYSVFDVNQEESEASILFTKDLAYLYSYIYDSTDDELTYFLTLEADSITTQKMYENEYLKERLK